MALKIELMDGKIALEIERTVVRDGVRLTISNHALCVELDLTMPQAAALRDALTELGDGK